VLGILRGFGEGDRESGRGQDSGYRGQGWSFERSFGARRQTLGASCSGPVGVVLMGLGCQNDSDAIDVSR
jgi:hypothetical protein